jgi:hypothetical protein
MAKTTPGRLVRHRVPSYQEIRKAWFQVETPEAKDDLRKIVDTVFYPSERGVAIRILANVDVISIRAGRI